MGATVEFCGEEFAAAEDRPLTIGRVADVEIDDNPYLHRVFLQLHREHELWWLSNVGSTLTATVADKKGLFQAWLSPGARIPLALEAFTVWFTAGPTTYDFDIVLTDTPFVSVETEAELEPEDSGAETTVGRISMTPDQKLLVVALCEDSCAARMPGRARSRARPSPPSGSAGRSPSSTASSTTSARSWRMREPAACTAAPASSRATARPGSSSTHCRPGWSPRATSRCSTEHGGRSLPPRRSPGPRTRSRTAGQRARAISLPPRRFDLGSGPGAGMASSRPDGGATAPPSPQVTAIRAGGPEPGCGAPSPVNVTYRLVSEVSAAPTRW